MATTYIESLLWCKSILLAIHDDYAIAQTAVYDTYLTIVKEILFLDILIHIETELPEVFKLQGLVYRHCTTEDEAVVVRISKEDRVCLHHLLHHEALTESLGIIAFDIFWMTSCLKLYMLAVYETVSFLCVCC